MGRIDATPYSFQFSLYSIVEWTTATAVLLGSSHYLMPAEAPPGSRNDVVVPWTLTLPRNFWLVVVMIMIGLVVASMLHAATSLWIALTKCSMLSRLGVATIPVGILTLICIQVATLDVGLLVGLFFLCQTILLVGSLFPIRLTGYRLIWRGRVVL